MSVGHRLRELDRRVLKDDRTWRGMAGRWRATGTAAVLLGVVLIGLAMLSGSSAALAGGLPLMLLLAFQTGYLKCEDDRLHGRQVGTRTRSEGV